MLQFHLIETYKNILKEVLIFCATETDLVLYEGYMCMNLHSTELICFTSVLSWYPQSGPPLLLKITDSYHL
jgi:hypothetical protein